jgi:transcriptional repressor NrdR
MRFASVYQGWESLDDFEAAITVLRINREAQEAQEAMGAESAESELETRLSDR